MLDGYEDAEFWDDGEKSAMRAYELYEEGHMLGALEALESAIESSPANSALHFNRALTLDALDRYEEAIQEYHTALEMNPDDMEILNSLAVDYTRTAQYDLAVQTFERIEQINPLFEPAYCNRIITYTEMGQHDKAEQMFYIAQQINSQCPLCFYNIGNSLFCRRDYKRAIWCWERTAVLEPEHPQINYRIAQGYWAINDSEMAQSYFLEELRKNPGSVDVLLDFSLFLLQNGNFESAKEKLNRILELNPDFAPAYHYLGELRLKEGEFDTAAEMFKASIKKDSCLAGPRYRLAQCALKKGDRTTAVKLLKAELEFSVDDIDVLLSMGSMLLKMKELDYAAHCFLRATDEDTSNPEPFYYLALALALRGEYADSLHFLEYCLDLDGEKLDALKLAAIANLRCNNLHQARVLIQNARKIAPEDKIAKDIESLTLKKLLGRSIRKKSFAILETAKKKTTKITAKIQKILTAKKSAS